MLITLLAAATPSTAGHGFFAGVHGGLAHLHLKKEFEDTAAKDAFDAKAKADPTLASPAVTATANNGLVGLHVGFAKHLPNTHVCLGALLEGHFLFGQNLHVKTADTKKDADFGFNALARLGVCLSPAVFAGVEAGLGIQQVKSGVEGKWPYSPLLGGFVGIRASQKVSFIANLRHAFALKQGAAGGLVSKPSGWVSTVGVSYHF